MAESSSSSFAALTVILFTITECPETEVATFRVLILFSVKILSMAAETERASMIAPSTTVSCPRSSTPKFTSSYESPRFFSSTALTALDPMSSPTKPFAFPIPNIGFAPYRAVTALPPRGTMFRLRALSSPSSGPGASS